jgi:hypothetical protein
VKDERKLAGFRPAAVRGGWGAGTVISTTKLWIADAGYNNTKRAFARCIIHATLAFGEIGDLDHQHRSLLRHCNDSSSMVKMLSTAKRNT